MTEMRIPRIATVGDNCMNVYDKEGKAFPTGNTVDVAVYIKRLGGQSSYIGAVGDDEYGQQMEKAIEAEGVDITHLRKLHGPTAVNHVELVEGDRIFGQYEEGVLEQFTLTEEDLAYISGHDLVISGVWWEVDQSIPELHKRQIPIAFDFSTQWNSEIVDQISQHIDYAFFTYNEEAKKELHLALQQYVHQEDMAAAGIKSFMKMIHKKGAGVVVVTMGDEGSLAWDGKKFYGCGTVDYKVVDTIGAEDSYIAGFLMGILQGKNIEEAMEEGQKSSAITMGHRGVW